jgi:hypothetical protein
MRNRACDLVTANNNATFQVDFLKWGGGGHRPHL